MGRVTLRITGTQLLCQDEHPSLLAALESHTLRWSISAAKDIAAPVVPGWLPVRLTGLRNL